MWGKALWSPCSRDGEADDIGTPIVVHDRQRLRTIPFVLQVELEVSETVMRNDFAEANKLLVDQKLVLSFSHAGLRLATCVEECDIGCLIKDRASRNQTVLVVDADMSQMEQRS